MIRQTHQVASGRGLPRWALSALLLAVSGCTVECHSSTSHSTSSSSGSERTVVHEHEPEHKEPRPQSGRGDVVRVSGEKHVSTDSSGNGHGRGGDDGRHVVHPSGSTPSNYTEPESGGSAGASGADSAAAGGASGGAGSSSGADSSSSANSGSGGSPSDSGANAGAATDQPEAVGKKPRTPGNKRENEPHVARPVKRRPVSKSEGREADDGATVNKSGSRE
jgi:hypothetical protein